MRVFRTAFRFSLYAIQGLLGLILTFYLLLAFGWLGSLPDTLATRLSSVDITTVRFHGLHTDLFSHTSADSVIVSNTKGLEITITSPDIRGNLLDFAFNRHLNRLSVERLLIDVPPPAGDNTNPPTLTEVLESIDLGIVTSADSLILIYGAISDTSGIIVDSMYLKTSVTLSDGVLLGISDIGAFVPGFGGINGGGSLGMEDNIVSTDGFSASAAPGALTITGSLTGEGAVLNIDFSGSASTVFLNLPVSVNTDFAGRLFGTLSKPEVFLSFANASASVFGNSASISIDSLYAGLDSIVIDSLQILNEEFNLLCNGHYKFASAEWNAALVISAFNLDVDGYFPNVPTMTVSGDIRLDADGTKLLPGYGSIDIDLQNSEIAGRMIEFLQIEAQLDSGRIDCSGNVAVSDTEIEFLVSSEVSPDLELSGVSTTVTGSLYSARILRLFGLHGIPDFSKADFRIDATGILPKMTLNSSVELSALDLEGTLIDYAKLSGSCDIDSSSLRADCSLLIDSIHVLSTAYRVSADAAVRGTQITVGNILATNSTDRITIDSVSVDMGPVSAFYLNNITATRSKLRMITQGSASGHLSAAQVRIDTLWIDPPVGYLGLSGAIGPGSDIDIDATLYQFDFTTLATLLTLPVNLSGVGDFDVSIQESGNGINGYIRGKILNPEYDLFRMDSLTVDVSVGQDSILINNIYCWRDSVQSEFRGKASGYFREDGQFYFDESNIDYFYMDAADIGDWLFYSLPLPFRTLNASVTAKAEYIKNSNSFMSGLTLNASADIDILFITALGASFPNVQLSLDYPDTTNADYNTKFTMNAGNADSGELSLSGGLEIQDLIPFTFGKYSFNAEMNSFEIPIVGMGTLVASGPLSSRGDTFQDRPRLFGDITIERSILGIPEFSENSSGGGTSELPFDFSIDVSCPGDVWVRSSYANIEVAMQLNIFTLDAKPAINGTISCVRGILTLYQRELSITDGTVTFVQGHPVQVNLNIRAESTVRSVMSREEYTVVVTVTGNAANPVILFSGIGPNGTLSPDDAMTLLSIGMTYGELQQINTTAFRTGVEGAAQTLIGSYLARNLRSMLGLDTFEIAPELLTDSTSLVVDAGKYVLPNLFLSYKIDVFSTAPGIASAQYMIMRNLFVEGSTRTTIYGEPEPTIELHYIFRY